MKKEISFWIMFGSQVRFWLAMTASKKSREKGLRSRQDIGQQKMHFRFKIGSSLAIPLGRDKHVGASRQFNIFYIVPLDPAQRAGLAGHVPVGLQIVENNIEP